MTRLLRGAGAVLGLTAVVSAGAGVALRSVLVGLNALGFIGICALSCVVIFYAVGLERIGFRAALQAAGALVAVFAGSAATMTVILLILLAHTRFRQEAARFGLHSVAGLFVLGVLIAVLVILWRGRRW